MTMPIDQPDHGDLSISEVAEGLASRRASIPENRGRLWHLGSGLRVADSSQVAGWSKGLFPHTSRDAFVVVCFLLPGRLHFQPAICAGSS